MSRHPFTSTHVLALALVGASAVPATADEAPATRQKVCEVRKIVLKSDDAATPPHSILVSMKAVDGAEPTTSVQVLGTGGEFEAFDVDTLEVGESQSFRTKDGRSLEITRSEAGLVLNLDGKTIELPQVGSLPGVSGATAAWVHGADGAQSIVRGRAIAVDGDQVTVSGVATEDVVALAPPHAMFVQALRAPTVDFDKLESLKGLEPDVRAKVIAALEEILASPHVFTMNVDTVVEDGESADGKPHHVVVRTVRVGEPKE